VDCGDKWPRTVQAKIKPISDRIKPKMVAATPVACQPLPGIASYRSEPIRAPHSSIPNQNVTGCSHPLVPRSGIATFPTSHIFLSLKIELTGVTAFDFFL
jgi:hypothetical protein